MNFETQLAKLQEAVKKIESVQLSLEESMKAFEEGVQLVQSCHGFLKAAELKVTELSETAAGSAQIQNG